MLCRDQLKLWDKIPHFLSKCNSGGPHHFFQEIFFEIKKKQLNLSIKQCLVIGEPEDCSSGEVSVGLKRRSATEGVVEASAERWMLVVVTLESGLELLTVAEEETGCGIQNRTQNHLVKRIGQTALN